MAELPLFGTNVDKSKVPPIHQKRIVNAFVNTFIIKTATFLEEFVNQCEDKLLRFEVKLRQVDTQLKLIEAKLESVPAVQGIGLSGKNNEIEREVAQDENNEKEPIRTKTENDEETPEEIKDESEDTPEEQVSAETPSGVKAKDDFRYKKYFKMIQFGVPAAAIRPKLIIEGLDPDILDTPDKILPDGVIEPIAMESSDTESD